MLNADPYDEHTIRTLNRYLQSTPFDDPFDTSTLITPYELHRTIQKLHSKKAAGPDKITPTALKHLPRKMIVLLTRLFNTILQFVYFPPQYKVARVIVIPKPGKDLLYTQNHRPISLLPTISKVFERLIYSRLFKFVHEHNLIPDHQFGFRPQFNIVGQLVRVVETITLQQKGHTIGIFLNTSKAFDRIWHNGLLYKLYVLGFHYQYLRIVLSYLLNALSSSVSITDTPSFIPSQPAYLKVLFLHDSLNLYTSDLPTHPHSTLATFADDTAIFAISQNQRFAHRYSQQHLEAIEVWTTK